MGIKILLICGASVLLLLLLRRSSLLTQRLLGLVLFGAATAAVLFPDLTTVIARVLGVGRGADLLLYVTILLFAFGTLVAFLRIGELKRQVTLLTRAFAIHTSSRSESRDAPHEPAKGNTTPLPPMEKSDVRAAGS